MAKMPKIDRKALMDALYGMMGQGKARATLMGEMANRPEVEQMLSKLVSGHANRMGGKLTPETLTALLRQGGANLALPGAGLGAAAGFFTAPGQEEENLLGMKKYRKPDIGDRLMSALTYGAGGAALGAGIGAMGQRSTAKRLLESGASPDLIQDYISKSNLMPSIEKQITGTARGAARGAAGAANAVFRSPEEMSNAIGAMYQSVLSRAQSHGFRDPNVIAGVSMISNLTGMAPTAVINNPSQVTSVLQRSIASNFSNFDNKSMEALKNLSGVAQQGALSRQQVMKPGLYDRFRYLLDPSWTPTGSLIDKGKRYFGMGTEDLDQLVRDFTRADTGKGSRLHELKLPNATDKEKKRFIESLTGYGKLFKGHKDKAPILTPYSGTGPDSYSGMLDLDAMARGSDRLSRLGRGAGLLAGGAGLGAGLLAGGAGLGAGLGAGAYALSRRRSNQDPYADAPK